MQENILLLKNLFKGRADVFALRWEKNGKNGYTPAYFVDPYMYKRHRMMGGTFQNYSDKHYKALTDAELTKHLNGEQLIGLYPLLQDNTSWFIVADFDEANWQKECRQTISFLKEKGIPAYLERSRSGKGGHVWIFFEQPHPAFSSRKILSSVLEASGIFSVFDKHSSFDRLFPNQDYLSGKGLGNLIALPFHKTAMDAGNSCFIDPETFEPFTDQWVFLKSIEKISSHRLDILFQQYKTRDAQTPSVVPDRLQIRLRNAVYINRNSLTRPLINFLKDELNFVSSEFYVKKKMGRSTYQVKPFFKMIEEVENEVVIPRGFIGRIIRFCRENNIDYDFSDERVKMKSIGFPTSIVLREYQKPALAAAFKKDFGVIVAPPGSGKTIIGLSIIANKLQPALIVVHRKQLADQWADRIESFLGIPKRDIGKIGQGKHTLGKHITIAMIQSLEKLVESNDSKKWLEAFGTIIVDECHHLPAETFRKTIARFCTYHIYGLTATPFRKYNDGKFIFLNLGDIISEIKPQDISEAPCAKIIVRNTELYVPFNTKTDKFETLSKIVIHDTSRNKLIVEDVIQELDKGKKIAIITERKEHIDSLFQYLKQKYEAITLCGDDTETHKASKWKMIKEGNFQVLITTGQYFGEGTDIQNIDCLSLAYPFSFEGKLIQYIGRVQRSELTPTIYDYRDHKIEYLEKLFQKRNTYYKKIYLQGSLFDQQEITSNESDTFVYEKRLTLSFKQLEFKYGIIGFKHLIPGNNAELEFEIENDEIRPEFEVLKPYFSKILKVKKIRINVLARFVRGVPILHSASSPDLDKINKEIVESIKFQFVSKGIIGKGSYGQGNLVGLKELQESANPLYNSESELLEDILSKYLAKHSRQLIYLSQKHEHTILKLRFVLSPFSFVFLLSGKQKYHVVWETLDSEEATYMWHIEKTLTALKNHLKIIDSDIGKIRMSGRQSYIESKPDNFSRIVHDYSNELKGFVTWKALLEERLT